MVISNLAIEIFEKLKRSNQYALKYNGWKSSNAEGMSESEQILNWQNVSEEKEKRH